MKTIKEITSRRDYNENWLKREIAARLVAVKETGGGYLAFNDPQVLLHERIITELRTELAELNWVLS